MKAVLTLVTAMVLSLCLIVGIGSAMNMSPNDAAFGSGGNDPGFTPGNNGAGNSINNDFPGIIGGHHSDDSVWHDGFDTSNGE